MRGLKPSTDISRTNTTGRIFYRCVDWNLPSCTVTFSVQVASFTDAWIETTKGATAIFGSASRIFYRCVDWNILFKIERIWDSVASFTDAWIETVYNTTDKAIKVVASFTDAWIETISEGVTDKPEISRIFYRCVDWNTNTLNSTKKSSVASFTDAWIETFTSKQIKPINKSRIFYRCVDWNTSLSKSWIHIASHLLQMRGLKPFS